MSFFRLFAAGLEVFPQAIVKAKEYEDSSQEVARFSIFANKRLRLRCREGAAKLTSCINPINPISPKPETLSPKTLNPIHPKP